MIVLSRFLHRTSLVACLVIVPALRAVTPGTPLAATPLAVNPIDTLLPQLVTTTSAGVTYIEDTLTANAFHPVGLSVHTNLADPAHCGRRAGGWSVDAGVSDAYTYVVARDIPVLGNRSQLATLSFRSTQAGVARGEHGLVEMRLCRGTTADDLPLRIRIENGCFYILGLNGDTLLAGDRERPVFTMSAGIPYKLTVILFAKAVLARIEGADVPGTKLDLVIPDLYRFIPGRPGFGLRPNVAATSGALSVFDWLVTPVAPAMNRRLAVIGDSITAGMDREPEAESYVHLTTRALGQELVFNTGSGGSSTAVDLARFPFEIAPFRPAIVWIEGGTNDIGTGVSAEAAFANMQQQAELVTWGGRAVFSTVPPRVLPSSAHHEQLNRLNQLIRASGRPYIDRHALVSDPGNPQQIRAEYRHPDGIHINRTGHARIAESAAQTLAALKSPVP